MSHIDLVSCSNFVTLTNSLPSFPLSLVLDLPTSLPLPLADPPSIFPSHELDSSPSLLSLPISSPSALPTSSLTSSSLTSSSLTSSSLTSSSAQFTLSDPSPVLLAPILSSSSRKKKKKSLTRLSEPVKSPSSLPIPEPNIEPDPLTCDAVFNDLPGVALVDSGSQADVISSQLAHRLGIEIHRLLAPVHADLGAEGHEVRLSLFASLSFRSGTVTLPSRSFFVSPLPPGIDAILGLPWMRDTGAAVNADSVFLSPSGPHEPVVDLTGRRFNLQPQRNFLDLGFTQAPMSPVDQHRFAQCALIAGMTNADEFIDFEPVNPLMDNIVDDPTSPDISEAECSSTLDSLLLEFNDILVTELPADRPAPFRPVNHSIPLINPNEHIRARVYPMPDKYKDQFAAHANKFIETGWWVPAALESACSIFAVPKHETSQARFVINLKPRNANTRKMNTPLPDMRSIRTTVASHPYRSKLDFKNAYEQIRVIPEDVHKTGFASPLGTFVSKVVQQGDCNAPETMHRVCYMMFRRYLGHFLEGFYDDWFIYSKTRRAHLQYLRLVFTTLRHYRFLLSSSKLDCFSSSLEALGAVITDEGVSVDPAKWSKIASWPTPRNPKDILRFMGLVQWMSDHVPHLSELAAPLTRLTGKTPWNWSKAAEFAFTSIKELLPRTLKPLAWNRVESGEERVFVFTDASMYGCGGWIGQGPTRDTAIPFRFHSAKFNPAQHNYSTTDQELLAVLECTLKFKDHLIGRRYTIVSDHEPLKTYWDQPPKQTRRHVRTWHALSEFDFDWEFIPGKNNSLADSLSRLAELDSPLENAFEVEFSDEEELPFTALSPASTTALAAIACATIFRNKILTVPLKIDLHPSELIAVGDSTSSLSPSSRHNLMTQLPSSFVTPLPSSYLLDPLLKPIVISLEAGRTTEYSNFTLVDNILFMEDSDGWRLVVPRGMVVDSDLGKKSPTLREAVIHHAHETLGHLGPAKTLSYIRRFFYWPHLHKDVFDYCRSCESCARAKSPTASPFGLLHPNSIPKRPWSWVAIDFVVGLPPVPYRGQIVDSCLTATETLGKMVHIFPIPSTATASQVADVYHDGIYRLHGMQEAIISDRDPKFTSGFWNALHRKIGTKLRMSTSAHPQTDGQSEVTNKTVGQIMRIFAEDNPDDWPSRTPDLEFAINSAPSAATSLSPFEVAYGYLPTSWPVDSWTTSDNITAEGFGERAKLNWLRATDALIASRVEMITQGNKHRRTDSPQFQTGNLVYVSTKDLTFPAGMTRKFVPKFVGPYPITRSLPASSNYEIAFPPHFRIHSRFHASKLRPHFPNDDDRFPSRKFDSPPPDIDASDDNDAEYLIEKVVADKMVGKVKHYKVRYLGYSSGEDQWVRESDLRKTALESIEEYLALVAGRTTIASRAAPLKMKKRQRLVALLSSFAKPLVSSSRGGVSARVPIPYSLNLLSHFPSTIST